MNAKPAFIARFVRDREPWPRDEDGVRQLRLTLKRLLRQYGWRATAIEPEKEPAIEAEQLEPAESQ